MKSLKSINKELKYIFYDALTKEHFIHDWIIIIIIKGYDDDKMI